MTTLEDLKSGRLVVVPPVSVKPLEWDDAGFAASASVQAFGLTYALQNGRDGWFAAVVGRGISEYLKAEMADLDAAKAAAQADYEARVLSALAASPDHTTALLSLVEGMERGRDAAGALLHSNGTPRFNEAMRRAEAAEARALAAEAKVEALREALAAVAPYVDCIVCYASTVDEHDGNRVAKLVHDARALTQEPNNG